MKKNFRILNERVTTYVGKAASKSTSITPSDIRNADMEQLKKMAMGSLDTPEHRAIQCGALLAIIVNKLKNRAS